MSEIQPNGRFRPQPGVVFRRVEDEAVLLDTRSGVYFGLNETGAVLWQALEAGLSSLLELEAVVMRSFATDSTNVQADVRAWLRELENHGLLERVE